MGHCADSKWQRCVPKKICAAPPENAFLIHQMCADFSALTYDEEEEDGWHYQAKSDDTPEFVLHPIRREVREMSSRGPTPPTRVQPVPRATRTKVWALALRLKGQFLCRRAHPFYCSIRNLYIALKPTPLHASCRHPHLARPAVCSEAWRGLVLGHHQLVARQLHSLTNNSAAAVQIERGAKLSCSYCGLKGATLGCQNPACDKRFHYPCLKSAGCVDHIGRRNICCSGACLKKVQAEAQSSIAITMEKLVAKQGQMHFSATQEWPIREPKQRVILSGKRHVLMEVSLWVPV
jgi:hypothetical protein